MAKRTQYADLGIPEYWIVEHPQEQTISVLMLLDDRYSEATVLVDRDRLATAQMPGLELAIADLFTAVERE